MTRALSRPSRLSRVKPLHRPGSQVKPWKPHMVDGVHAPISVRWMLLGPYGHKGWSLGLTVNVKTQVSEFSNFMTSIFMLLITNMDEIKLYRPFYKRTHCVAVFCYGLNRYW